MVQEYFGFLKEMINCREKVTKIKRKELLLVDVKIHIFLQLSIEYTSYSLTVYKLSFLKVIHRDQIGLFVIKCATYIECLKHEHFQLKLLFYFITIKL